MTAIEKAAAKVVALAEQEIGYREKATNAQLDDRTANAGFGNYTRYARDLHRAGFFGGSKQGYPWCAVFVTWVAWKLCGDAEKARQLHKLHINKIEEIDAAINGAITAEEKQQMLKIIAKLSDACRAISAKHNADENRQEADS